METVAIANVRPSLLHLPPVIAVNKDGMGNERQDVGEPFTIMAGDAKAPKVTDVPAPIWQRVKSNPVVREWIRLGWIREATKADVAPNDKPIDLMSLAPVAAITIVEVEDSREVLRDWLRAEDRVAVKAAIGARLAVVNQPAKK